MQVRRVGVLAHQRPCAPRRRRRDDNCFETTRVAQPAPQECAAMAVTAMQRHHQRQWPFRRIAFRYIERITAATAAFVVKMHHAGLAVARRLRRVRDDVGVATQRRIEVEAVDDGIARGERIQRLQRARQKTQRTIDRIKIVAVGYRRSHVVEGRERETRRDHGRLLSAVDSVQCLAQRIIRRAHGGEHLVKRHRIKMPCDEFQHRQRAQQRRQDRGSVWGHCVVPRLEHRLIRKQSD